MKNKNLAVIILAAGKGTRMKSKRPKVLHTILGRSLLRHSLEAVRSLNPAKILVVVGHQSEQVKAAFPEDKDIQWVLQSEQLGTAHAVLCAEKALGSFKGSVLIVYGDVPLLRGETLQKMLAQMSLKKPDLLLATAHLDDPSGYGRIVRETGRIKEIVEEKEASPQEKEIHEINPGIYVLSSSLLHYLEKIEKSIAKGEYYLTDLVAHALKQKNVVDTYFIEDAQEIGGINDCSQLAEATRLLQKRINQEWMKNGVSMMSPETTWIEPSVSLESDIVLHPGVVITGNSKIKSGAEILAYTVIEDSEVHEGARIGPFAHLRPASVAGKNSHVGNFVELKKTILGNGSKANHLSYLGDAVIGDKVNVGAGTITCNYDGVKKFQTVIQDGAFIGSDTQLVAPVTVGKNAYVGSGTTVTKDVPAEALAISRTEQKNVLKWKKRKK